MNSLAYRINLRRMAYPSISNNMWELLNHWFLIIGNGYEWVDGELVPDEYDSEKKIYAAAKKTLKPGKPTPWAIKESDFGMGDFVGASKHSAIMTIPLDAKPEWKACVVGLCRYIIKHDIKGLPELAWDGDVVTWAKKALERLEVNE